MALDKGNFIVDLFGRSVVNFISKLGSVPVFSGLKGESHEIQNSKKWKDYNMNENQFLMDLLDKLDERNKAIERLTEELILERTEFVRIMNFAHNQIREMKEKENVHPKA